MCVLRQLDSQLFVSFLTSISAYMEDITWPRGETNFIFEC